MREKNLREQKSAAKLAQKPQTRQSTRTRLAFLAAAGVILAIEIYIAICVKGGFVRHYAGDVLAIILLYALTRAIFSEPPPRLPLKIFAFAAALELAQYLGAVQILGIENKILKVMIGGTFDFADLLCYAAGCVLAGTAEKFESKTSKGEAMDKEKAVQKMTEVMAKFVGHTGKVLPDDVTAKLSELSERETQPLAKEIYKTMFENQRLAKELDRPSCQDTGVIQFFVRCGANFPLIGELEELLREAVLRATREAPLRHNSVETFDEYNTGKNVGKGTPSVFWEIVPDSGECEIHTYMAGGGCSLPGKATVLMPGMGYEGVVKFVMDIMTSYGINACPPLLVGVGVGTSIDVASLLSKKALMRPLGSHNPNDRAALTEKLLEDGINKIGLGPQGMSGASSVMGVHIENCARHPSVIAVAVNVGCWSHRKGHIVWDEQLSFAVKSHKEFAL